jgi:hypothetical protein
MSVISHGLIALLHLVPVASAADSSTTTPPSYGSPGFLFLLIAYFTRRREIGGWLMLYYWGLYAGAAVTLFLIASTIGNLAPSEWAAVATWRYVFAVISSLLPVVLMVAEVVVASVLLSKRNLATVQLLRKVMIGFLLANLIAVGLDYAIYIKPLEASVLNIYSAIVGCIWLAYFYMSVRVKSVFVTHSWDYIGDTGAKVMAPAEKKYRNRRALIIAAVFFVAFYTWFSFTGKNTDSNGERFIATGFIALIVGLFAYFLPIFKKKRGALNSPVLTAENLRLEDAPPRPTPPPIG